VSKRQAMAMAAGLVVALLAGVAAFSVGLSTPGTAQAGSDRADPIVRTVRDTITVHEQAKADSRVVQVVSAAAPQLPADDRYEVEDRYEDDGRYEDDHDEDDHDDDRYEREGEDD